MAYQEIQCYQDSYCSSQYPNTNYGNDDIIRCNGVTVIYTSFIKFQIFSVPIKDVVSATLKLYCSSVANTLVSTISARIVTSQWDESTITWNNQPTYSSDKLSSTNVTNNGIYYYWDVTQAVSAWIQNTYPNYGIALVVSDPLGDRAKSFASSENTNSTIRPVLQLNYTPISDLVFIDQLYGTITDNKGNPGNQLDISQIVAGNVSSIKAIDLHNYNTFDVLNPIVWLENLPPGDTIEISKFNDPFISSPEVHFDGTFAPNSKIGTFYIRVKSGENSSGSKSFRIKAKATPV